MDETPSSTQTADPPSGGAEKKVRRRRPGDGPELVAGYDEAQCLDDQGAARFLGMHVSSFYEVQRDDPDFPEPVYLLPGNRMKRWPVRVLRQYVETKIKEANRR